MTLILTASLEGVAVVKDAAIACVSGLGKAKRSYEKQEIKMPDYSLLSLSPLIVVPWCFPRI
ncbi:hypothetical protein E2C01_058395 [Portunus trituberculatus]|uniref:Uncharacterized protein n=1 Tax=Portunus trituberculatus TaxID=210409 RepID=A0A5B7H2J2_PORTR|nr:hypothetical protein [Portunus trituberculatus]